MVALAEQLHTYKQHPSAQACHFGNEDVFLLCCLSQLRSIGMVGYVLGPFIFAACMFGMVMQVSRSAWGLRGVPDPIQGQARTCCSCRCHVLVFGSVDPTGVHKSSRALQQRCCTVHLQQVSVNFPYMRLLCI
jgi:hypothetical protein